MALGPRRRARLAGGRLGEQVLHILDHHLDGVLVTDPDGGVLHLNPAAECLLGAPVDGDGAAGAADRLWHGFEDAEGRAVPPAALPPLRASLAGEAARAVLRRDGRWLRLDSRCVDDEAGRLCVTALADVTAEVAAREDAAEARAQVDRIAAVIDQALHTVELCPDGSTRLTYASRGFERLVGTWDAHGAGIARLARLAHPDDAPAVEHALAALRRGEQIDVVLRIVDPEGATRWLRWRAITRPAPAGSHVVDGILADITAEEVARAQLAASEAAQRSLAREHAAIGRLATAVARGDSPASVFQALAAEVAGVLGAPGAFVAQFDGPGHAILRGIWPPTAPDGTAPELRFPTEPPTVGAEIRRTRAAARTADREDGVTAERVGAPIVLGDELWGYIGLGAGAGTTLADDVAERLKGFAELVATAVASAAARERLVAQASTDPLTGLANHRVFEERLHAEADRARRHDRALTLVLIDLDHFKHINDAYGHQTGDTVLRRVAGSLSAVARSSDMVARLGGDEFAMILPEADADGAAHLIERARRTLAEHEGPEGRLTLSAGVAHLAPDADADALFRAADEALYWAKAEGRDGVRRHAPGAGGGLSPQERVARLARSEALAALQALARVVDAKDPSTREHSRRVAAVAADLARALEWPESRVARLQQAALVHDVGLVAVPDAVLRKPGALDAEEYEEIKRHAMVGAAIASEALDDEQVAWIRHHHERPDGRGYPDGLHGPEIPVGAHLLAIADAWDVMTSARRYKPGKPLDVALEECSRLAGAQFDAEAIAALRRLRTPGDA